MLRRTTKIRTEALPQRFCVTEVCRSVKAGAKEGKTWEESSPHF